MSFIARYPMLAMLVMAFIMVFGGNVLSTFAAPALSTAPPKATQPATPPVRSLTQVNDCMLTVLDKSAVFSGTLPNRFKQARRLPAGTELTMPDDSTVKTTDAKASPWSNCEDLPVLASADTKASDLEIANGAFKREVTRLEGLAYETINARDRTGFVSDGSTWKDRAAALKGELETANDKAGSATSVAVLLTIVAGILAGIAFWLFSQLGKARAAHKKAAQALFELQTQKPAQPEVPTPPSGDADLEAPTAPEAAPASTAEAAPEAPTPQPEVPEFLERLKK